MPPLNFISSGRSVRKRLPLEKFVDYTHCCESSITLSLANGCNFTTSFAQACQHANDIHSRQ